MFFLSGESTEERSMFNDWNSHEVVFEQQTRLEDVEKRGGFRGRRCSSHLGDVVPEELREDLKSLGWGVRDTS